MGKLPEFAKKPDGALHKKLDLHLNDSDPENIDDNGSVEDLDEDERTQK